MSANLDALVAGIRAKRNEKLPQAKERLAKLETAREAVETTRTKASAVAATHPELQAKLGIINYGHALSLLDSAITSNHRSVSRLSRESINIGVAGRARQGKSQILQMITGLGDKQIPTGDGGFCTGSRSVIRNGNNRHATIYFKTAADLMAKVILPAYRSLSISPSPASVEAFIASDLPTMSENASFEKGNEWNYLNELHNDLRSNRNLLNLLDAQPTEVGFDDLRRYVTKDEGDRVFQVVDHVDVETPFDSGLPKGMLVFDLPGLEDPAPGILESMLTSIKEDSDIVILMRMPKSLGDGWDKTDIAINDKLREVYEDPSVKPCDWMLMVLNHTLASTKNGDNGKNVDSMLEKVPRTFPGFPAVKCDCGTKDAVRKMLTDNIETLVQQTSRIDNLRIHQAEAGFAAAMDEVRSLYRALREASADIVAQQCGFDFDYRFTEFKGDLRDPLKMNLKSIAPDFMVSIADNLRSDFEGVFARMQELYAANENSEKFPDEFPILSKKHLVNKFRDASAAQKYVGDSVRNQREALFMLFRSCLEKCCQKLNQTYFENVVALVFENKAVRMATHDAIAADASPRAKIEAFARLLDQNGNLPTLVAAVLGLLSFNLTFESAILPAIYGIPEFMDFNPEQRTAEWKMMTAQIEENDSAEERAEILYDWQKDRCEAILSSATSDAEGSALSVVSRYVSNIMQANFGSFIFRFIWGEDCEKEWERFARSHQAIFWKDEFEAAERNSAIARDWNAALSGLRTVVG